MKIEARSTFERDIKKIKDRVVKRKIKAVIQDLQKAEKLADLNQVKKLAAHSHVSYPNRELSYWVLLPRPDGDTSSGERP